MKRIISFTLALVLALSLCVPALALTLTPQLDKTSVAAGEDVSVTLSLDEQIDDITGAEIRVYFDGTLFDYKDGTAITNATIVKNVKTDGTDGRKYMLINYIDMAGYGTIPSGTFATLNFTAKADIADTKDTSFSALIAKSVMVDSAQSANTTEVPISVTVTPAMPDGYVVTAAAAESAEMNSTVTVPLSIKNKANESYNAYYLEVTYDTAYLTYSGISVAGTSESSTVDTATAGTLKIAGVSNAGMTCGENVILLTFDTITKSGETDVTVSTAKIDDKANANAQDAPDATISNPTTKVTINARTFSVTLPEGFTGPATVTEGEDYVFTQNDLTVEYTITATMGGESAVVTEGENDGEWVIYNVTGDLIITAKNLAAPDMVTIIETGNGWEDVYIRGGWDKSGDTVLSGTELTMMIDPVEGRTYTVTVKGQTITSTDERGLLLYTIPDEMVTGDSITIDVSYTEKQPAKYTVEATAYLTLDGKSMFLITASSEEELAEGKVLSYGDNAMFWSEKYNAWAWLVISDKSVEEVKTEAAATVTLADGTKTTVAYEGDVNMTGAVDINDAQLVCNMYNVEYQDDFTTVSVAKFLRADVTGDKNVNVQDVAAIIALVVQ